MFNFPSSFQSNIKEVVFPAIPNPSISLYLAVIYQLEQSQWWSTQQMLDHQFEQLNIVLSYGYENSAFYQETFNKIGFDLHHKITPENWRNIPILTRSQLQESGDLLLSKSIPPNHGKVYKISTSGSTGKPITAYKTEIISFFWNIFTLREHIWQQRDCHKTLSSIRLFKNNSFPYPEGKQCHDWGHPINLLDKTGLAFILDLQTDVKNQLEWLTRKNPDYLLTFPSNVLELAKLAIKENIKLSNLLEICTVGEVVDQQIRDLCKQAWNVPIKDIYSSQEVGYIALQCPENNHYHIQSENLYVEILNEENQPCKVGEIGRVVVTTLHNFAMPLIRYEIGDYAQVGEFCSCGRGLPVLTQIMGRVRNMLTLPTGEKRWPVIAWPEYAKIAKVKQQQLIQKTLDTLEVRLVTEEIITPQQEKEISKMITKKLGYDFDLYFTYPKEITRSKSGKFEEFISEISRQL
jgi:phenylacetate-CoA ligase